MTCQFPNTSPQACSQASNKGRNSLEQEPCDKLKQLRVTWTCSLCNVCMHVYQIGVRFNAVEGILVHWRSTLSWTSEPKQSRANDARAAANGPALHWVSRSKAQDFRLKHAKGPFIPQKAANLKSNIAYCIASADALLDGTGWQQWVGRSTEWLAFVELPYFFSAWWVKQWNEKVSFPVQSLQKCLFSIMQSWAVVAEPFEVFQERSNEQVRDWVLGFLTSSARVHGWRGKDLGARWPKMKWVAEKEAPDSIFEQN